MFLASSFSHSFSSSWLGRPPPSTGASASPVASPRNSAATSSAGSMVSFSSGRSFSAMSTGASPTMPTPGAVPGGAVPPRSRAPLADLDCFLVEPRFLRFFDFALRSGVTVSSWVASAVSSTTACSSSPPNCPSSASAPSPRMSSAAFPAPFFFRVRRRPLVASRRAFTTSLSERSSWLRLSHRSVVGSRCVSVRGCACMSRSSRLWDTLVSPSCTRRSYAGTPRSMTSGASISSTCSSATASSCSVSLRADSGVPCRARFRL
mmetsp:Transcript_33837/g.106895  ORF Transcript_33837/g.106895 Transcript_33837/m.106895 type:complete len:263 (-) Transcript_33837:686-1474(-)